MGITGALVLVQIVPLFLQVPKVRAQTAVPGLSISQFKITASNGQFVELYNNSDQPIDMSTVQLAYYNNYDLTKATSSKLVSLSGTLAPHSYYLVNDGALNLCYQTMVASASLSFSSTAGMVQVLRLYQASFGAPLTSELQDYTAWSRTAVTGVTTLPATTLPSAFHRRVWPDGVLPTIGGGSWQMIQPSSANPCVYETVQSPQVIEQVYEEIFLLPPTLPPVQYVAAAGTAKATVNRNVGKMAPVVNELLPNPASPQTDADDEFIELYNPNDSSFDLSGFKLAFGSTKPKKYTFPEGTILQPKEFKAFTSGDTSISLSNTEAQVWLLDPNEKIIGQSEPYSKAKDGQAWALNGGAWVWTSVPSPNVANTLTGSGATGSDAKPAAAVLGITSSGSGGASTTVASTSGGEVLDDAAPLHPGVLAGVGIAALAYGLYEYRHDLSNRIFQFRRYLRLRRAPR